MLQTYFPDITFTGVIVSEAYGQPSAAAPYANMMASCTTIMPQNALIHLLKTIESEAGNTRELRSNGIVMMDIDLMKYDDMQCHTNDWERPYIKRLYSMLVKFFCLVFLLASSTLFAQNRTKESDPNTVLLGKAVEYYTGGKYHESSLLFEKIEKNYRLTPRFLAYLGFSYYKEGRYQDAIERLETAIPNLKAFSPKEQSVYIYACAESLFLQQQYKKSMKYYDILLPMTEGNDKGDVLFHKAFSIYMENKIEENITDTVYIKSKAENIELCYGIFNEAIELYRDSAHSTTPSQTARLRQSETIVKGFERCLLPYIQKKKSLLPK